MEGRFQVNSSLARKSVGGKGILSLLVGKDFCHKGKDEVLQKVTTKDETMEILETMLGYLTHDIMIRTTLLIGFTRLLCT